MNTRINPAAQTPPNCPANATPSGGTCRCNDTRDYYNATVNECQRPGGSEGCPAGSTMIDGWCQRIGAEPPVPGSSPRTKAIAVVGVLSIVALGTYWLLK